MTFLKRQQAIITGMSNDVGKETAWAFDRASIHIALVNNAGMGYTCSLMNTSIANGQKVLDLNLKLSLSPFSQLPNGQYPPQSMNLR